MDTTATEIIHSFFPIEWKRSHNEDGDLFVHIPAAVFDQSYRNKNIPRTVAKSLEMASLSAIPTKGMIRSEQIASFPNDFVLQ